MPSRDDEGSGDTTARASKAAPGVDVVADDLYGVPPQQFTPRRDDYANAAKDRGDRIAAKQIMALRKPSISAWLANLLVRAHPDEIDALLVLGAELREAQAGLRGAELRTLSQQRRQLVNDLVRQARHLAGRPVGEQAAREVEQTLEAALADEGAAATLRAARLTSPLTPDAGFGSVRPQLHVVRDALPDSTTTRRSDRQAAARRDVIARNADREALDKNAHDLEAHAAELRSQLDDLTRELTRVHESLMALRHEQQSARRVLRDAERAAATATRAAVAAKATIEQERT